MFKSKVNAIIYGISMAHKSSGLTDPSSSNLVKNVKNGILRKECKTTRSKAPITDVELSKLVSAYGKDDDFMNKRFVTISLLSFSGFLRFNEVANLRRSDLRIESDHVQVFITMSKTDQYAQGQPVIISATGTESCPVKRLINYLKLAGIVDGSNEFIFRNIFGAIKK